MEHREAFQLANKYLELLTPACDRIEIVGSVKRADKDTVHDLEILLIAKSGTPRPVFGSKVVYPTHLDKILYELKESGLIRDPLKKANGLRYKKFALTAHSLINDFCLDLFIVNEKTWGIQNVIRTGPSLFSHSFVTNQGFTFYDIPTKKHYQGLLPDQYRYIRGETKIMQGETTLSLPEESDALAVLGLGWIEPKNRRKYIKCVHSS